MWRLRAGYQATQFTATCTLRRWIAVAITSTLDSVGCRCATATELQWRGIGCIYLKRVKVKLYVRS